MSSALAAVLMGVVAVAVDVAHIGAVLSVSV
jgi:hypothetical protein